ncbi:hypothetical protein BDA99DRAFT_492137 [Phascolomyces articulosus]|uniref:Homeobox domain-containing protein n=1 Tax=Phascolomyces articulosus TaxID=60185 RepID=A0AAD5KBV0_9FUNG|nr:hypothetical protein BDA99DRAFT_492137 [Phascolomyces articulosus]
MSSYFPTSPMTRSRTFSPVILFHDHQYVKDGNGGLEHIHIPYGDPHYGRYIETHKKRIHRMLEHNEKFWTDVREYTEPLQTTTSPIASVTSSPTPPLYSAHDELASLSPRKRYRPYYIPRHHHHQQQQRRTSIATQYTNTAGSVLGDDTISVSSSSSSSPASPHSSSMPMAMMDSLSHPSTPTTPGHPPMTPTSSHHHHHHHPLAPPPSQRKQQQQQPTSNNNNNNSNLVKRRRGNLPKAVTAILREWLSRHKKHPYPTEDEKAALARQTNLTLNQISNWFINARRRILQPMLQKERQARMLGEEEDHTSTLDIFPYTEPTSRRGRKRSNASSTMDVDITKHGPKYGPTSYETNLKRRTSHQHPPAPPPPLRRR